MPEPAAIAVVSATPGLRLVAEMSLRHHHVQRHALLNVALGIAREAPAVDGLHRHADFTRRAAAANGVAAPELFPAKARFQGQMLARTEGVCITQRVGNGKGDGDRIAGFRLHFRHGKRMKCRHRNLKYI